VNRLLTVAVGEGPRPPLEGDPVRVEPTARGVVRLVAAVRALVATPSSTDRKPTLVLLGSPAGQRWALGALVAAGLRPSVRIVLHVRAAEVPFRPETSDLFGRADLIVVESAFGARAVEHCCRGTGVVLRRPIVTIPPPAAGDVPHGTDSSARAAIRRVTFGVAAGDLLVGCFTGGGVDHPGFLALRIFRSFADGLYWWCGRCDRITVFDDDYCLKPLPISTCPLCSATDGRRGQAYPRARLFLARRNAAVAADACQHGRWSLRDTRRAWTLEERVILEGDRGVPPADSPEMRLERLSALDIHLAPHHLADVDGAIVAGCAMGVPTIATRFGAVGELFDSCARLVAPRPLLLDSEAHWTATIDVGAAVRELVSLAQSAEERTALAASARDAMRALRRDIVAARWREHIERLGAPASPV
jgi:hypothetical protein